MAASSPAPSNNSNETGAANGTTLPRRSSTVDAPKQSLRGLNKPKCIKCGNVARSRCPYQSCKSCCAKAQNPCHIHVLKPNATFPDKPAPSSSQFDKPSSDASPSGASLRFSSLRPLSNNFSQFDRSQVPRARKPLSWKDVATINAWRFSTLKEYNDRNVEAGNEAFDRYMQNVSLLEEAFGVNSSLEGLAEDGLPIPESLSEGEMQKIIWGMKATLKSDVERVDKFRKRLRDLIDQGFMKLKELEFGEGSTCLDDDNDRKELKKPKKTGKRWAERTAAVSDLLDKLNKAKSGEELKFCLEIKQQLFNQKEVTNTLASGKANCHENGDPSENQNADSASVRGTVSDKVLLSPHYSLPNLCTAIDINQEILSDVAVKFSSLGQVVDL